MSAFPPTPKPVVSTTGPRLFSFRTRLYLTWPDLAGAVRLVHRVLPELRPEVLDHRRQVPQPGRFQAGAERFPAGRGTDSVPLSVLDGGLGPVRLRRGSGAVVAKRGTGGHRQFLHVVLSRYAAADPDPADLPGSAATGHGAGCDQCRHHRPVAQLRRLPERDISRRHPRRRSRPAGSSHRSSGMWSCRRPCA